MINVSNNSHPTHAHLTIQRTDIHKNRDMRIKTKEILCARIAERIPERIAECIGIIIAYPPPKHCMKTSQECALVAYCSIPCCLIVKVQQNIA